MNSESKLAIAQPIIRHSRPLVKWHRMEQASEMALSPVRFVNESVSVQARVWSLSLPHLIHLLSMNPDRATVKYFFPEVYDIW